VVAIVGKNYTRCSSADFFHQARSHVLRAARLISSRKNKPPYLIEWSLITFAADVIKSYLWYITFAAGNSYQPHVSHDMSATVRDCLVPLMSSLMERKAGWLEFRINASLGIRETPSCKRGWKVRELILHVNLILKVITLKLFLDRLPVPEIRGGSRNS